jgi:hypothetical protein
MRRFHDDEQRKFHKASYEQSNGNLARGSSLWLAEALARSRHDDEARLTPERMYTYANQARLYIEEIGPCCRCPVTELYSCVIGNQFGNRALERNGLKAERSQP